MNANPNVSANADTLTAYAELNADADTGVMLATEGFRLIGRALSVIRRDELYRAGGFPSFRAYLNHKTGEWKAAHGKSPSYKHLLNIVTATNWLDTVAAAGLVLEAGSEYEVRQARQLARRLDMADDAAGIVKLTRAVLGANVSNSTVKALTEVMTEYLPTGAITFSDGEQFGLKEATLAEIKERIERARLYRMAKWISQDELIEQLQLGTTYNVGNSVAEFGFVIAVQSRGFVVFSDIHGHNLSNWESTIFDALLSALATLYAECEAQS